MNPGPSAPKADALASCATPRKKILQLMPVQITVLIKQAHSIALRFFYGNLKFGNGLVIIASYAKKDFLYPACDRHVGDDWHYLP